MEGGFIPPCSGWEKQKLTVERTIITVANTFVFIVLIFNKMNMKANVTEGWSD